MPTTDELGRMSEAEFNLYRQQFRQQLKTMSPEDRRSVLDRLNRGMGIPALGSQITEPSEEAPKPSLSQIMSSPEVPLWQKGLAGFAAPFQFIHEKAIEPFAAIATAPFSPTTPETAGLPGLERHLAEYKQWDAPWGVKGAVETLPWFALPGIGTVAGKGGMIAGRGIAGMLGRAGTAGKVAGTALEYSPWGLAEKAVGKAIGAAVKPVATKAARNLLPSRTWKLATEAERVALAKEAGVSEEVASKLWSGMKTSEKTALSDKILKHVEEATVPTVPSAAGEGLIPQTTRPAISTMAFPSGFNEIQQSALAKLTRLVKETKPVTKETLALRKPEQAARIGEYERQLQRYVERGMPVEEADSLATRALYGKYPEAEVTEALNVIRNGMTGGEVQTLFKVIADAQYASGFTRRNTIQALQDLLLTNKLQQNQIRLLEETFGPELARELLKKRTRGELAKELAIDLVNAPRALLASCDISGLLRQGAILFTRNPIQGLQTVKPSLAALLSDKNAAVMDSIIRSRKGMTELLDPTLRVGLDLTALPYQEMAMLTQFEESFASKIVNKIPFVRGSNRAYVTVLNDMRSRSALNVLDSWKKAGIRYTKDDVADLNQLINWASGRGTLPGAMQKQGKLLNALFFAPRLQFSRIQFPSAVLPLVTKSALVRREAWRQLLTFVGTGAGILTMAKLSGAADVELDPRSADFGKMKVGSTRLDIWSGYTQYLRFVAQLSSAQSKTQGGRIQELNRRDTIMRFAQTKFSPATGLINDLLTGESYLGEELPPKSAKGFLGQLYQRTMPLAVQDLIDGINQDGPLGGIISSAGFLGIGVVTYTDDVKKERDKASRELYGMDWEEVGRQLGRAAQLHLEQTTPAIIEAEQEQEDRFAASSPSIMKMWRNEGQAIEDAYREAIRLASREFQSIGDGTKFREKVDAISDYRRTAYATRAKRNEYQDIIAYYQQPLEPEKMAQMNPGDVLRRDFYQQMFSPDMYDEFGNYRFDEAARREQVFLQKYGQQALDYIEEYRGSTWVDKPVELKLLEETREMLQPYWQIEEQIWSMYSPEIKQMAEQISLLERIDTQKARMLLYRYPQILMARRLIAQRKQMYKIQHPEVQQAIATFYSY